MIELLRGIEPLASHSPNPTFQEVILLVFLSLWGGSDILSCGALILLLKSSGSYGATAHESLSG